MLCHWDRAVVHQHLERHNEALEEVNTALELSHKHFRKEQILEMRQLKAETLLKLKKNSENDLEDFIL